MSTLTPTFKLIGAVAISATTLSAPVLAQQAMSEPAYCAFYYPNANCQNKGPGNPYSDPNYRRNAAQNSQAWSSGETVGVAGKRSRTHRSVSSSARPQ
ncbi:hypothetical protein SAMN05444159_7350 [Bradyrhizobium lablabi]|uniref:Uncharacterized protein n=1 Tax=Bradyrhizobium lablabi TaxID=722472 RepID=A0A1M7F1B3_9BRAD|nr:hypothetical protein [Bradyrhizobium lablabi]SHL97825.1 hypothetical protein SAMN05444159_7350 [Bradyrhizobium lablabi]